MSTDIPNNSAAGLRILYLTHYYPPEVNAPAVRVSELAREWRRHGHSVVVQTGFPNHPTGVLPERYRDRICQTEIVEGTTTLRSWVYATPNKGLVRRVINYLSFMLSTILLSSCRSGKADVVIATSPQFFVAIAGWVTALMKRAPFVFEVRDLWPEEIVAVGAIKNRTIIRALEIVEMFLYRRATLIVAVAQGTVDSLVNRGISASKIILIPNGVSMERFEPSASNAVRESIGFKDEFLVSYIGTHGMAHRLETVLGAASKLRFNNRIKFLMVGDGAEKEKLMGIAAENNLDNITFAPQTSTASVAAYYQASDVCLAPLRRASLFQNNVPSKIYEIMAAGRPILLGATGESQRLVEDAGAGMVFEPENDTALAERITSLFEDRPLAKAMGESGRKFVAQNYRREALAENYLDALKMVVASRRKI